MDIVKGDTVWMTSIDEYGMLGREYHPCHEDLGICGEVLRVETFTDEVYEGCEEAEKEFVTYSVVTVLTYERDPKFLELMDYEVTKVGDAVAS